MSPPALDPVARDLMWYWRNKIDGEHLTEFLPDESRDILTSRSRVLEAAFVTEYPTDFPEYVAEMLRPYGRLARVEPKSFVWVLRQHLMAPVWAALEAIKRVRLGQMPKAEFPPLPSQLRAIAWGVAGPFQTERMMIGKILRSRPPRQAETSERRREVAARVLSELRNRGIPVAAPVVAGFSSTAVPSLPSTYASAT